MSDIQFAFNPVPSGPSGGGKFPWFWILLIIAITAMVAKELHESTKKRSHPNPLNKKNDTNRDT